MNYISYSYSTILFDFERITRNHVWLLFRKTNPQCIKKMDNLKWKQLMVWISLKRKRWTINFQRVVHKQHEVFHYKSLIFRRNEKTNCLFPHFHYPSHHNFSLLFLLNSFGLLPFSYEKFYLRFHIGFKLSIKKQK